MSFKTLAFISIVSLTFSARTSVSSQSDLESVYSSISALSESIRNEQKSHETSFHGQLLQCESEIKYREKELSDAKYAYSRAVVEHDMCMQGHEQSSSKYSHHQKFQQFITGNYKKTLGIRGLEQDFSMKKIQNYDLLLKAAGQVVSCSSVDELVEISNSALKNGDFQVASALAQVAKEPADTLLRVVQGIQVSVRAARQERISIDNDIQMNYEKIVNAMENVNKGYEDTFERLDEIIGSMEECMERQENMKFIASDMELRSQNLLRDIGILCKDWADQFQGLTANRKKEIDLLASLGLIAAKRFI